MVSVTVPSELDITMDEDDPTDQGDIKVVRAAFLELDDCDAITQWSVHSGVGVTIEVDNVNVYEGTGSIKAIIPAGITGIIKCTKSAGAWDLSVYKYLKVALLCSEPILAPTYPKLYFGEAAYDEQTSSSFGLSTSWYQHSWDISAIADADCDGVTMFSVYLPGGASGRTFWIDYVFSEPGLSQIKAYDGSRVITMYPKVLHGIFTGNGTTDHTIFLSDTSDAAVASRKGTPVHITVIGSTKESSIEWSKIHHSTGGKWSLKHAAAGHDITAHGITEVGDGYFIISSSNTNTNNILYGFAALYED